MSTSLAVDTLVVEMGFSLSRDLARPSDPRAM